MEPLHKEAVKTAVVLKGGRVIDPAANLDRTADVLIDDGVVVAVESGASVAGAQVIDCSGLIEAAWGAAGRSLPHNAAMQWNVVAHISRSQLALGDLVFYDGLGHVAMYVGNNQIIHAPHAGTVVQLASIDIMTPYGYGRVR